VKGAADWYAEVYEDRFYVEVMANIPEQMRLLAPQRTIAKYYHRPTVGTNDVHYLLRSDGVINGPHHVLVQARKYRSAATTEASSGDQSDDSFGSWYGSDEYFMKTRTEMLESGLHASEVDATLEILDRVEFDFYTLPQPEAPSAYIPEPGEDPAFDRYLALNT
jgi:DNA polymerase III alpha subunit